MLIGIIEVAIIITFLKLSYIENWGRARSEKLKGSKGI